MVVLVEEVDRCVTGVQEMNVEFQIKCPVIVQKHDRILLFRAFAYL